MCCPAAASLTGALGSLLRPGCLRNTSALLHISPKPGAAEGNFAGLQENQLAWAALWPAGTFAVRRVSALLCTWLSPPCRMLSSAPDGSVWSPCGQRWKGGMGCFVPIPRVPQERPATPNELCDMDTTYHLQTWARMALRCGQAILRCPRHWRQRGETRGSWQLAVGPGRVQGPQKCLGLSASAPGLQHGAGTSWGFAAKKTGRGDPGIPHTYPVLGHGNLPLCPSPSRDPESSTASPGVDLSCLLTAESLTSRPRKWTNFPELSCAQVFAGSTFF